MTVYSGLEGLGLGSQFAHPRAARRSWSACASDWLGGRPLASRQVTRAAAGAADSPPPACAPISLPLRRQQPEPYIPWWPASIDSPTLYYQLKRRAMSHQFREQARGAFRCGHGGQLCSGEGVSYFSACLPLNGVCKQLL